jgi:hypothetical protein
VGLSALFKLYLTLHQKNYALLAIGAVKVIFSEN